MQSPAIELSQCTTAGEVMCPPIALVVQEGYKEAIEMLLANARVNTNREEYAPVNASTAGYHNIAELLFSDGYRCRVWAKQTR